MRTLLDSKKGQIGNLEGIISVLIVVGVLLGVAFFILEEFRDNMTAGSEAYLGVNQTIVALATVPTWLPIIIIVAIAGIILAIVFAVIPRFSGGQV